MYVVEDGSGKTDKDAVEKIVGADQLSVTIDGLKTWTDYKVWIVAFNKVGDGPASAPVVIKTDEDGRYLQMIGHVFLVLLYDWLAGLWNGYK